LRAPCQQGYAGVLWIDAGMRNPRARTIPKSASSQIPEWATTIMRLRNSLGLNQESFGESFHCSAMAVSRWERGISEPISSAYIELGNVAGDPLCWYSWGRAGLSREDLTRVVPRLQERLRQARILELRIVSAGTSVRKTEADATLQLLAIPLLKTVAASIGENGDDHEMLPDASVESMIAAPKDWCPNPSTTSCLLVGDNSISPLI
jgi:DNA-binding transcriptional regulator YiaG